MAEDDLTLRMRAQGARQSAREVDRVTGSVKKYSGEAKKAGSNSIKARAGVRTFGGALKPIASVAAGGAAALGVVGLAGAAKSFVSEFRDSQKVTKQTNAVLKSTHGVANVSAKGVANLATSISNKTGIDDEAIQSGSNMLLTFTNVRNAAGKNNKIFNQASRTMVDMGAAMHKGPGSASIMLGKALNDPTKGMTALRKVGVKFTKGQTQQVEAMQKSGNMMGAQRVILGELNKEFGGSAQAQADPIDKATVAWGNLQEQLGGYLWPIVTKVVGAFGTFVTGIQEGTGAGGQFKDTVVGIGTFIGAEVIPRVVALYHGAMNLYHGFQQGKGGAVALVAALGGALAMFLVYRGAMMVVTGATRAWAIAQGILNVILTANPIGLILLALVGLGTAFVIAYKKSETFRNGVNAVWGAIKNFVAGAPGAMKGAFEGVLNWVIGRLNSAIDLINSAIDLYNKIPGHGDVGHIGHIGEVGGGGGVTGANTRAGRGATAATQASTGHAARGGVVTNPGAFEVGERGREVVHLGAGDIVQPHGGFGGGETVVPVTLVMPNGEVLARTTARAARKKRATR